jgi:hypothetical protein
MDLTSLRCGVRLMIGVWVLCLATGAGAQESLDRGKSPAQLFASDCSLCHKSPQGLLKSGGFGLDNFLREHYTASRETASAIASYLRSMDSGSGRASKRTAKGDDKTRSDDKKKTGVKPGEAKGMEKPDAAAGASRSSGPKSAEPRSSEPRPGEIMTPEPKAVESKPSAPAADEPKPAIGAKPEKSD